MKDIQLEVRLKDKILSVNGKEMTLDNSLYDAVPDISRDSEQVLDLRYRNQDEDFICAEGEEVYSLLEGMGLDEGIEVSPCAPYDGKPYSNIAIVGNISSRIC